jgi:hypothetical protein
MGKYTLEENIGGLVGFISLLGLIGSTIGNFYHSNRAMYLQNKEKYYEAMNSMKANRACSFVLVGSVPGLLLSSYLFRKGEEKKKKEGRIYKI